MGHTDDLSDAFFQHTVELTAALGIRPLDLLAVEAFESGVRADAMNPSSKAVGLIQFMPQTLKGVGWMHGPDAFRTLDADSQLPYVDQYLKPYKGALTSVGRVYQAVFLPASITYAQAPGDVVCGTSGPYPDAYKANAMGFDTTGKGTITVGDLAAAAVRATKALGARWTEIVSRTKAAGGDVTPPGEATSRWPVYALVAGGGVILAGALALATHPLWGHRLGEVRENPAGRPRTTVQTLLFRRDEGWTAPRAKAWARRHGYRSTKVDVTPGYVRLRQKPPSSFSLMRTVSFGHGIKAVVGR